MLNKTYPFNALWRDVNDFRHEMDRFLGRLNPLPTQPVAPAINVWEDEANFYAELDLPAIDVAKLDITITEGNRLSIQGERKPTESAEAVWHRQERYAGNFAREITLPTPVDPDKVQANYEQGVLKLVLPKSETAKPRKIVVKGE